MFEATNCSKRFGRNVTIKIQNWLQYFVPKNRKIRHFLCRAKTIQQVSPRFSDFIFYQLFKEQQSW